MFGKKKMTKAVADVIESVNAKIERASAKELAGLISGRYVMFVGDGNAICVLPEAAQDDGAQTACHGRLYDLAVSGLDSDGYEFLTEAVQIVGETDDFDDLEEDDRADDVRAAAIEASQDFADRCRAHLRGLIKEDYIAGVLETRFDDKEQNAGE